INKKKSRNLLVKKIKLSYFNFSEDDTGETKSKRIKEEIERQSKRVPHPSYVLLVGDSQSIPPFLVSAHPGGGPLIATDLFYATEARSHEPQLAIGRLPARNPIELSRMIEKINGFERALSDRGAHPWGRALIAAYYQNDNVGINANTITSTKRTYQK